MKFRYHISTMDLFNFLEYHMFHSLGCIMAILIPVLSLVGTIYSIVVLDWKRAIVYLLIFIISTLVIHLQLWFRALRQAKLNESMDVELSMELDEEGLIVHQNEEFSQIAWEDVVKLKTTRTLILVYTDPVHSYLIPKQHMEWIDEDGTVKEMEAGEWEKVYDYISERVHV